jgi:hypothetical protein
MKYTAPLSRGWQVAISNKQLAKQEPPRPSATPPLQGESFFGVQTANLNDNFKAGLDKQKISCRV